MRRVEYGGLNATQLRQALQDAGVQLNPSAETLLAHSGFVTTPNRAAINIKHVTVADLGFSDGATPPAIFARAQAQNLLLCPVELGAHYRLQYTDQPEGSVGFAPTQHRAPPGSVTIASEPISEDDSVPKGLYLRRIEGVLWLRGYNSSNEHVWNPEDVFAFRVPDQV